MYPLGHFSEEPPLEGSHAEEVVGVNKAQLYCGYRRSDFTPAVAADGGPQWHALMNNDHYQSTTVSVIAEKNVRYSEAELHMPRQLSLADHGAASTHTQRRKQPTVTVPAIRLID